MARESSVGYGTVYSAGGAAGRRRYLRPPVKYPIGIQDFRSLREGGNAYVDKTEHIVRILRAGTYLFLSRPRRLRQTGEGPPAWS